MVSYMLSCSLLIWLALTLSFTSEHSFSHELISTIWPCLEQGLNIAFQPFLLCATLSLEPCMVLGTGQMYAYLLLVFLNMSKIGFVGFCLSDWAGSSEKKIWWNLFYMLFVFYMKYIFALCNWFKYVAFLLVGFIHLCVSVIFTIIVDFILSCALIWSPCL